MILRILQADNCGPHCVRLAFNDGSRGVVDVLPLLSGPVFEPLLDPAYFARFALDPECGTVTWPNGADFAPEALHALVGRPAAGRVAPGERGTGNNLGILAPESDFLDMIQQGVTAMAEVRIVSDPAVMLGKPVVAGTRVTVELILDKLAAGEPVAQIQRAHPHLPAGSVEAALAYAAAVVRNEVVVPTRRSA